MSGTTAIVCFFKGAELTVANVGDSRAIVGEKKGKRIIAYSLSIDQTPYRADERERVKAAGAVVMSCDQLEGIVPFHENWGVNLGEELDNGGDPPRVWAPGKSFPGCAFTRSIGDHVAESIGVTAEPELLVKEMTREDKFVIVASDGVWEFLTNQSVTDMVLKFDDPLEACRAVVAESYRLWLQYEVRTDDITMIMAFLDWDEAGPDPGAAAADPRRRLSRRESRRGSADNIGIGLDVVSRGGGENRPVRRGLSKEKRQAMMVAESAMAAEEDDSDWKPEIVPKSPDEVTRIRAAVRANFLFQHLNEQQAQQVYNVMKRVPVKKGEVVIRQGDAGDWFYVVDAGEFSVTLNQGGKQVEILKYTTSGNTNPCFGELALMYSKPRAATVTASKDGVLWAMDRRSFRAILMKSSAASMIRTLRSVDVLKSLTVGQLQRLQDMLTEMTFNDGDYVITQGEHSETFYVILDGRVRCTKKEHPSDPEVELMQLGEGQYFGERALLQAAPRAANVIAMGKLKCLYISKDAFEEVLGPLQKIINDDRAAREKVAMQKQLQQETEGLAHVSMKDFTVYGVPVETGHSQLVLVTHKQSKAEYTLKAISKTKAVERSLQNRIMTEKALLSTLATPSRFVPLALTSFVDEAYLFIVFKTRVATELDQLIERGPFSEKTARFYAANIILALEHLHSEGIVYRNLMPENISIDMDGYVQLMDLPFAIKLDDPPARDFCGLAHYLSPEQVSGQGHSLPVDFWALGVLIYEMVTGSGPWITGDPNQDSEVAIYNRISGHQAGHMPLPNDFALSEDLVFLLNELLEPNPMKRIGARGVGAEEFKTLKWFDGFTFAECEIGEMLAPHADTCAELFVVAEKAASKALPEKSYNKGDVDWYEGFGSFLTPRK
jgi:CRP-like cAMP-binding protein/serine/threonine protein phosphatase PrpC